MQVPYSVSPHCVRISYQNHFQACTAHVKRMIDHRRDENFSKLFIKVTVLA